ncbi:MAG: LysM peptidoglycan-binding domain-containing protein [Planctomycetes bacterium]|nr:LysM peptidoglycan-binding domain-containing protein [Planctomycetota bacterium]
MRGVLLLISIVALMALVLVWKFQTGSGVEAAPPPADPSTGRVVVGLAEAGPALPPPVVSEPVVEPPYQPPSDPGQGGDRRPAGGLASADAAGADAGPAAPVAPPSVPAEPARVHYTVAEGDTLYSILRRTYGVAKPELIDAVAAANRLADAGALEIGQRLALPVVPGFPAPELP